MASIPVIVSITVEDGDGEVFSVPLYGLANDANTLAQMVTQIASIAGLVDAVIDGRIAKLALTVEVTVPGGVKGAAVAGSEVERTGLYSFDATGTPYAAAIDFPAMALATLVTGTNQIDPANTDVAALVTGITSGFAHFTPTDKYANLLASLRGARKTFRKHRKSTKLH